MTDTIGPGEAARRLGVSVRTVQRWLREGRLPAVRVGARVKVAASALPPEQATTGPGPRIERLLVANRGELVVRIARTCRELGITSLALVAEDQARAWWPGAADEMVPLRGGYLDGDAVLAAAHAARADAIHPGYGFLAENGDFAAAVVDAGLTWVGPPAEAMRALGDKAAARRLAARHGIPVLPGYDGDDQSDKRLAAEAARIGFPVLVKPSGGGGGKGMHVVRKPAELPDTLVRARREAKAAFGDERLILERYLARPRHIEVQLLADAHGHAVHLGERECSLQRRHQKVIEEAPSVAVGDALRARLGEAALTLARAGAYVGAGTAEFLLDEQGDFFFLELNARLQVEHPVTELVVGRDLVADQLAIAQGRPLDLRQADVRLRGHAIEARLYAEDPYAEFVPATGEILAVDFPAADGLRVDSGIGVGDVVGTRYDPLLAKLVATGTDRGEALDRLEQALAASHVVGVTTNRGFLRWLLAQPEVRAGELYTSFIDERWQPPEDSGEAPEEAWPLVAAAVYGAHSGDDARRLFGFRLNAPPRVRISIGDEARPVDLDGSLPVPPSVRTADGAVVVDFDGRSIVTRLARAPTVESAASHATQDAAGTERVAAPMPGTVLSVHVAEGDQVSGGQVLVVLEAMKMENTVPAPGPALVKRVLVSAGQTVQRGEPLVELA